MLLFCYSCVVSSNLLRENNVLLGRWWSAPGVKARKWHFGPHRPEKSHFSQSESPLGAFSNKIVFLDTKAQIVVMVDLLETEPLELNHWSLASWSHLVPRLLGLVRQLWEESWLFQTFVSECWRSLQQQKCFCHPPQMCASLQSLSSGLGSSVWSESK